MPYRLLILKAQTAALVVNHGGWPGETSTALLALSEGHELIVESVARGPKRKGGRISTVTLDVGPIIGASRWFEIPEADFVAEPSDAPRPPAPLAEPQRWGTS